MNSLVRNVLLNFCNKKQMANRLPLKSITANNGALVATAPSVRCGYFTLNHAARDPLEISMQIKSFNQML